MPKKVVSLLLVLASVFLFAEFACGQGNQQNFPGITVVTSAPNGSCPAGSSPQLVSATGVIYTCQNGSWLPATAGSLSATQYYPLAGNSTGAASYPTCLVTNTNSGGDIGARIANLNALSAIGGNNLFCINARAEIANQSSAAQPLSTNPFGGTNAMQVWFPSGFLQASINMNVITNSQDVHCTGLGSTSGTAAGTRFQAQNTINQGSVASFNPALLAIGTTAGGITNATTPFYTFFDSCTFDANSQPGEIGLTGFSGQEGSGGRRILIDDSCTAYALFGGGTHSTADGMDFDLLNTQSTSGDTCPGNTGGGAAITAWSIASGNNGKKLAVVTYTPQTNGVTPAPGMTVIASGTTNGVQNVDTDSVAGNLICAVTASGVANNGNWVNKDCAGITNLFSGPNQFAYVTPTTTGTGSAGTANFYPTQIDWNGDSTGGSSGRGLRNTTISSIHSPATATPVRGLSVSGNVGLHADGVHIEEASCGICLGADRVHQGGLFTNIFPVSSITDALYVSNLFGASKNYSVQNLLCIGDTNCVLDIPNSVTLTAANNPFVGFWFVGNTGTYPFTDANSTDLASTGQAWDLDGSVLGGFNNGKKISLDASNGAIVSQSHTLTGNAAASTPIASMTGNIFTGGTGTSTLPFFLIKPNAPTAASSWSTAGTLLGMNAPNAFAGNFVDFHVNGGASVAEITAAGTVVGNQIYGGPAGTSTVAGQFNNPTSTTVDIAEFAVNGSILDRVGPDGSFTTNNFSNTADTVAGLTFTKGGILNQSNAGTCPTGSSAGMHGTQYGDTFVFLPTGSFNSNGVSGGYCFFSTSSLASTFTSVAFRYAATYADNTVGGTIEVGTTGQANCGGGAGNVCKLEAYKYCSNAVGAAAACVPIVAVWNGNNTNIADCGANICFLTPQGAVSAVPTSPTFDDAQFQFWRICDSCKLNGASRTAATWYVDYSPDGEVDAVGSHWYQWGSILKSHLTWTNSQIVMSVGAEVLSNLTTGANPGTVKFDCIAINGQGGCGGGNTSLLTTFSTGDPGVMSSTQAYSSLTSREAEHFVLTNPITVNQISYNEVTNTTAGTVKICVYTDDGGTKPIDVTITPSGTGTQSVTVGTITLNPGGYYLVTGCATTCSHTVTAAAIEGGGTLWGAGTPSGKKPYHGTVTHTSGTCNATLGTVTGGTDKPIGYRLDN